MIFQEYLENHLTESAILFIAKKKSVDMGRMKQYISIF